MVAYHPPSSVAPNPHGNVTCLVVERVRAVLSPCPPASDDDGGVSVHADVVLVAVRLHPVAFTGPERSKDLLFGYRMSSVVDLEIVWCHQPVERGDVEAQVGEEPFALRKEDLLDRIHLV